MNKNVPIMLLTLACACASTASAQHNNTAPAQHQSKTVDAKPKECPKGFKPWGSVSKIEIAKDGSITESVQFDGGHIQKLPKFKPTKIFNRKVGDPYCVDMTPDNN